MFHGGRGGGKSWAIADFLLIIGRITKHRILCCREIQKSISQSVHKLLSDRIQALGFGAFYEITNTQIRGQNGTEFNFTGLLSLPPEILEQLGQQAPNFNPTGAM